MNAMPIISNPDNNVYSIDLENQASDNCKLNTGTNKEASAIDKTDLFDFRRIAKESRLASNERSADLSEAIPCSSSSTTSSLESPNLVNTSTKNDSRIDTNDEISIVSDEDDHNQASNKDYHNKSLSDDENEDHKLNACHDPKLDVEIRARLDKLNALSDLINSLELQFDRANSSFREILKCSTYRLSIIAKKLGTRSLNHGRDYHAAKFLVEQSQSDCQRACVQFEQANHDHQFAKEAIKQAELQLREITSSSFLPQTTSSDIVEANHSAAPPASSASNQTPKASKTNFETIDLRKLRLDDKRDLPKGCNSQCNDGVSDNETSKLKLEEQAIQETLPQRCDRISNHSSSTGSPSTSSSGGEGAFDSSDDNAKIKNTAELSEMLNSAVKRLIEAEQKRQQSEKQHLDQANKLMIAQETMLRLEREHGASIRRSQLYFDEANRFKAKLNSIKSDIRRISDDILAAKQAYARTLSDLEQFSEDLHQISANAKQKANTTDQKT